MSAEVPELEAYTPAALSAVETTTPLDDALPALTEVALPESVAEELVAAFDEMLPPDDATEGLPEAGDDCDAAEEPALETLKLELTELATDPLTPFDRVGDAEAAVPETALALEDVGLEPDTKVRDPDANDFVPDPVPDENDLVPDSDPVWLLDRVETAELEDSVFKLAGTVGVELP